MWRAGRGGGGGGEGKRRGKGVKADSDWQQGGGVLFYKEV